MAGYIVCWSTGVLQDCLPDDNGEVKVFPSKEAANSAARADFNKMAALSMTVTSVRETFNDGMISLIDVPDVDGVGYAVWVSEYNPEDHA